MECILSSIIATPLVGAAAVLFIPREREIAVKAAALAAAGVSLLLAGVAWLKFDLKDAGMQFTERLPWIPGFDVWYYLGVDGLSFPLVLLTALLTMVSLVFSLNVRERVKEYFFWFLLLDAGMLGVFCALDFVLFYVFWEVALVPMYFLIGVWGGPAKEYAAIKFFLYTLFGSVFMLLGILALYFNSSPHTFDMVALTRAHPGWTQGFQVLAFLAFYLSFAIKVPAFPFHTWLPLAHVEAPTAGSIILAGVLLKMGVYGLLRVCLPILPLGFKWFLPALVVIAVINVVYGALCAMAQTDMKKMVAYSSINHMGYCLLGIAAVSTVGFTGAAVQMVAHGLITGALFLLVGVVYDRAHTRDLSAFGGLGAKVPVYAGIMSLTCFASLGLPGLAGFVGEFLCFLGGFERFPVCTGICVAGILVTAAFFLRMIQKVFLGPLNPAWRDLTDMDARELIAVAPLVVLTIALGVWPRPLLALMNPTLTQLVAGLEKVFPR